MGVGGLVSYWGTVGQFHIRSLWVGFIFVFCVLILYCGSVGLFHEGLWAGFIVGFGWSV